MGVDFLKLINRYILRDKLALVCEDATGPACKGVGTSESAPLEFSDYSEVDMLALQSKIVDFVAVKNLVRQIGEQI